MAKLAEVKKEMEMETLSWKWQVSGGGSSRTRQKLMTMTTSQMVNKNMTRGLAVSRSDDSQSKVYSFHCTITIQSFTLDMVMLSWRHQWRNGPMQQPSSNSEEHIMGTRNTRMIAQLSWTHHLVTCFGLPMIVFTLTRKKCWLESWAGGET
jgi:hypothetical protein